MGNVSINGRIALDGSGFRRGLDSADAAVTRFASGVRNKVGGLLAGAFGVNALKNFAVEAFKQGAEITKLAKSFNLTTTEVQLLQQEAERTGRSFEDLVSNAKELEDTLARIGGGDVLFDPAAVEALAQASEVIKAFKDQAMLDIADFLSNPSFKPWQHSSIFGNQEGGGDEMSPAMRDFEAKDAEKKRAAKAAAAEAVAKAERILQMEKETSEIREKMEDMSLTKEQRLEKLLERRTKLFEKRASDPNEAEGVARNELATAKLDMLIARARADIKPESKVEESRPIFSDSLTSIGNFLGGDPSRGVVGQLQSIDRRLERIQENTRRDPNGMNIPN